MGSAAAPRVPPAQAHRGQKERLLNATVTLLCARGPQAARRASAARRRHRSGQPSSLSKQTRLIFERGSPLGREGRIPEAAGDHKAPAVPVPSPALDPQTPGPQQKSQTPTAGTRRQRGEPPPATAPVCASGTHRGPTPDLPGP